MNCKYWKDSGNPRKPICTAGNSAIGERPHIGVCAKCNGNPQKILNENLQPVHERRKRVEKKGSERI